MGSVSIPSPSEGDMLKADTVQWAGTFEWKKDKNFSSLMIILIGVKIKIHW